MDRSNTQKQGKQVKRPSKETIDFLTVMSQRDWQPSVKHHIASYMVDVHEDTIKLRALIMLIRSCETETEIIEGLKKM